MINQPGLLVWMLFWVGLSIAALLPRTAGFDDAWRWAVRLAGHALTGPLAPLLDLPRAFRPRSHRGDRTARSLATMLALRITMSALFVALFASANPIIAEVFAKIRLPSISEIAFWLAVLMVVWSSLRPRCWATSIATMMPHAEVTLPGASPPLRADLARLVQRCLRDSEWVDLALLWSAAPLPAGVSLAAYAHRGAYPLIVTALALALRRSADAHIMPGFSIILELVPSRGCAARRPPPCWRQQSPT